MKPTGPGFCFVAPAYANSVPLEQFIPDVAPGSRVVLDLPARLFPMLRDGRADAALIPVADLFPHAELDMIDGLGICARRRVRSVLLRCRRPLDQVRTVRLDPASRTSNALAMLLIRDHWKLPARAIAPDDPAEADAAVVIGDRALKEPAPPGGDCDLAEHWNRMTGLPFVFAVWSFRRGEPRAAEMAEILHAAKRAGVAALSEIARQQARKLGLSEAVCLDYYSTCIYYDAGAEEREAMRVFRERTEGLLGALPYGRRGTEEQI